MKNLSPGNIYAQFPNGDEYKVLTGNSISNQSVSVTNTLTQFEDYSYQPIKEAISKLRILQFQRINYGGKLSSVDFSNVDLTVGNTSGGYSRIVIEELNDQAIKFLEEGHQEQERREQQQKCIVDNVNGVKEKAKDLFSGLLGELSKQESLKFLNDILPNWAQVATQLTQDPDNNNKPELQSVKVGDITYNPKDGTVVFGSETYSTFVKDGLSSINKILPPYLQMSLSELGVTLGDVTVDFDTLDLNPDKAIKLLGSISVKQEKDGIFVLVGNKKYNLTKAVREAADKGILYYRQLGLAQLNQKLPDYLQVSSDPKKGVSIGPVTFKDQDVVVDSTKAATIVNRQADRVFSSLPAPIGIAARAAWKSVDVKKEIDKLTGNITSDKDKDKSIALADGCDGETPATPPFVLQNQNIKQFKGDVIQSGNA